MADHATEPGHVASDDVQRHLRRFAWLLDSSIPVPGTRYRFGIDPLLGLIPGIGDFLGLGLSSYILLYAHRIGVPRSVLLRMAGNVMIETVVGVVPLIGDVFDAAWKANERNVRLMQDYVAGPLRVQRTSRAWIAAVIAALALLAFTVAFLVWIFLRWLVTTAS